MITKEDIEMIDENINRQMESHLTAAKNLITGERQKDYGSPRENFDRLAKMWSAYKGVEFSRVDAAMMLMMLKISREAAGGKTLDTYRDLIGYAGIAAALAHPDAPLFEEQKA